METKDWISTGIPDPCILLGGQPRSGTTLLSSILRSSKNHFQAFELHIRKPSFVVGLGGKYSQRIFADLGLPDSEFRKITAEVDPIPMNLGSWIGPKEEVSAEMLSGHETTNFVDELRARGWLTTLLMRRVARLNHKESWGFKILGDIIHADKYLEVWPNATFIFVIRDPRDYALSVMSLNEQRRDRGQPDFYENLAAAIQGWKETLEKTRQVFEICNGRCLEIRYEDLVANTSTQLKRLSTELSLDLESSLDFYQQDFVARHTSRFKHHDNLLKPINAHSVGKWQKHMTKEENALCINIAGSLMSELNYI